MSKNLQLIKLIEFKKNIINIINLNKIINKLKLIKKKKDLKFYETSFKNKFLNLNFKKFHFPKEILLNFEKYNISLIEYIFKNFENKTYSILEFCSIVGIFIPHYCYHPDLSIAGNCRMCLIQLDGSIKPIASCAVNISANMIINTQSFFVRKIQEVLWNFYY